MTEPTELLAEAPAEAGAAETSNSGESNLSGPRDFAATISDLLKPDWPDQPTGETEQAPAGEEQAESQESPLEAAPPQGIDEEQEEQEEQVQGWPDSARHRVDKLTARNGKLKEQLEAAQSELEAAKSEVANKGDILKAPPIPQALPFAELKTEAELDEKFNGAQRLYNEVQMLRKGLRTDIRQVEAYYRKNEVILKDEDGNEDFSRQRIEDHLAMLEDHARGEADGVQKRRAWNAKAAEADAACAAYIPWMKNPKSPEYQLAQEALKQRPEVMNFPDWKLIVAAHVMGMKQINEMVALVKQKGQRQNPPKAGARPGHAPGAPPSGLAQGEVRKSLLSGDSRKVQSAVASMLELPVMPSNGRLPGPRKV